MIFITICSRKGYGNSVKTISIISTTYNKEKASNLDECLSSIFSLKRAADEVVLVADGELTDELYTVVEKYSEEFKDTFVFHQTAEKKGNWNASNTAISLCKSDIIAKIDSDDILLPEYTQRVLEKFENENIDICGVYIEEFDSETGESLSIKKTPAEHDEIYSYAKRRNPFNNPGIAFSKAFADKIGAYKEMERCEDYDFVVRMLLAGAKGKNIPEVLVKYRTSKDNLKRRKNFKNTKWFIISRWQIYKMGFSSFKDFFITTAAQLVLFVMPVKLTEKFYKILRKN